MKSRNVPAIVGAENATPLGRLRDAIDRHHKRCQVAGRSLVREWILCGLLLHLVKSQLSHGQFSTWVRRSFQPSAQLTHRTAQRYMAAARQFAVFTGVEFDDADLADNLAAALTTRQLQAFSAQFSLGSGSRAAGGKRLSNEWSTPPEIVAVATSVLGKIECDPCTSGDPTIGPLADLNYTTADNGLDSANMWPGTAWIAPGHTGDMGPWIEKALAEFQLGHLQQALLWLPETALRLPDVLLSFPIALTSQPMCVISGGKPRLLPTRGLFVLLSREPDLDRFRYSISDIAVAFAPVDAARSQPPQQPVKSKSHTGFQQAFAARSCFS